MDTPDRQDSRISPVILRLATLLFPPLGLLLLWRMPRSLGRKILGTAGVLLFCVPYTALIVFLLIRYTGLRTEWRGGYLPALTYHRTLPNYDALERNRASHSKPNQPAAKASTSAPYWTGFRGQNRDGIYAEGPVLTNWPASGLRLLWKQPVGGGYASFAIAEGLAFTIEQRRDKEIVAAYQLDDGREVWTHGWAARFEDTYAGEGPRATPTYSDSRVFALGARGRLCCLEAASGKLIWSRSILSEHHAPAPTYGLAASPLVVDEKLIVQGGGRSGSVLCYDKVDGTPLWSALDDIAGYASPMAVTLAGRRQVLVCGETRTVGIAVEDGKVLWEYPWQVLHNQLPIAQPVMLSSNRFLLSAGYFTGCTAVEVTAHDSGYVARTLWQNKNLKNKFNSSVCYQGNIYGLDEDILTCLDAETGARRWKDGRYGYGQLLLASGHLVILSGEGQLALVKATPDAWQELAKFQAIEGKTWNVPAITAGKLFVRNSAEMACFDIAAP